MNARCCICWNLFDRDGDANISALACGHTFHEVCIMGWLRTFDDCPHCRTLVNQNHIVKKLYFDKVEDCDGTTDKLIDEVDQLRLELRKKQKHAEEVEERLNQRIGDILGAKKAVEKQYKKEQTSNNCLRKQLAFYESQQRALDSEREEYKSMKNKLLKTVQHLLEATTTATTGLAFCGLGGTTAAKPATTGFTSGGLATATTASTGCSLGEDTDQCIAGYIKRRKTTAASGSNLGGKSTVAPSDLNSGGPSSAAQTGLGFGNTTSTASSGLLGDRMAAVDQKLMFPASGLCFRPKRQRTVDNLDEDSEEESSDEESSDDGDHRQNQVM